MSLDTLKSKLNLISTEKDTKIIPENIKKDVTIFNVTGTLEGGSSDYNVKLNMDNADYVGQSKGSGINKNITDLPIIDFSNSTSYDYVFFDMTRLINIQGIIPRNSNMKARYMFSGCNSLVTAPSFDTSKITNMSYMFQNCRELRNIPLYNTTNTTSMLLMFGGQYTQYLTDESLNNILQMCINATSCTDTKTLATLLGSNTKYYTTSRMEALSAYQDFIDAGWTLGW